MAHHQTYPINQGYPAMTEKPALLLFPNLIGDQRHHQTFLPASVDRAVASIDGLIAESETGGRRYLGRFETKKPAHLIPIALYNEHTPDTDLDFLLEPIKKGERWGLVSDAGLPCLADPGAKLVARARQVGIQVQAFVGPSSITLALMLSGLPGQSFAFHGYLNKDNQKRQGDLLRLQKQAKLDHSTHIFMEAPYRNVQTLQMALDTLEDDTLLCTAWNLTLPTQGIITQSVRLWKKSPLPNIDKCNALFLLH